ncbi:snake venom serine protease homolog KN4-like [Maniola hyperantus]|uniref:snake venom serine protease homolog KN4-like n=1 Tax=Aphantopus hyperantus TaxID=2795564 RepID=UPI001568F0AC|nr:snake venom serine protease homolog KN4-like [Maniola hyperantus]
MVYYRKIMRVFLLAVFCAVASKGAVAENEVKRGAFPFMAFLYYTDETILDNGARFTRSAALIRNDWLISSGDVSVVFPLKTLLARLGAVSIDKNFTINEDEEEQEREVILILRPYNYSATEWWKTDISLLKTLLPFNMTSSVAPATLIINFDIVFKNCYILVYARHGNATERTLIQINVELLPPAREHCGNYYRNGTMVCAGSEKSNALADPNFCKGNSGGPLVCNNEYLGLQTYINNCKQPYLYQFVPGWNKLIACAAEELYLTQSCADICVAISKDPAISPMPVTTKVSDITGNMLDDKFYTQSILTESEYTPFTTDATDSSTVAKIEEAAAINEHNTEVLSTKINEEPTEIITIRTSILIENFSHDTTSTSTGSTYAEQDDMMKTTVERELKNHIDAKHQLVRGEASLNMPSLFYYLMTSVYVLACT